jgi:DNA-binding MarR family transcriptional regulator
MKTKSALIADINDLVGVVGDKFDADEDGDAERDFMAERCPDRLQDAVRSMPTLSMHLLAAISDGPVSVVGLAARSGQLKGTVSKHVQRLVEAGLVKRAPVPGNRKIELTPTVDGELILDAHRRMRRRDGAGAARLPAALQRR